MGRRYQEMDILSASPEMLVVKLYDGAIRFGRSACRHAKAGEIGERATALSRMLAIISELRNALDFENGGEIAVNLDTLYEFMNQRLVAAHLASNATPIEEVVHLLEDMRSAWASIACQENQPDTAVDAA